MGLVGKYSVIILGFVLIHSSFTHVETDSAIQRTALNTGPPIPDPEYPLHKEITPRIGNTANFTVHCLSVSETTFLWWHNGILVSSDDNDTTCASMVWFDEVVVNDFGSYLMQMKNSDGSYLVNFEMIAQGPPAPISDLALSGITDKSANITFISGFDYNDTQTFLVMRDVDSQLKGLKNVTGAPNDKGSKIDIDVTDLDEYTSYNVTVVSHNTRGYSEPVSSFVSFTTYGSPKPDPKFIMQHSITPRVGAIAAFTIHCLGDPKPIFIWWHNLKQARSIDSNTTCGSTVIFDTVVVDDFGPYMLDISNIYGDYIVQYEMVPSGPPDPVSDLNITHVTTSEATITFTTGYNYNSTQVFLVKQENDVMALHACNDTTNGTGGTPFSCQLSLKQNFLYTVTVVSENKAGQSNATSEFIQFSAYGPPKPNPIFPTDNILKPRLGQSVNWTIHVLGYPIPKFDWMCNGQSINSEDTAYTSTVYIGEITIDKFRNYTVNITNSAGSYWSEYAIIADGPPSPATNLTALSISADSVTLQWTAGFDYGNKERFKIMQEVDNGVDVELDVVNDVTNGLGGQTQAIILTGLSSETTYSVYLVAANDKGDASRSKTVTFTTSTAKVHTPVTVIAVAGGFVMLVVVMVSFVVIRRRKASYKQYVVKDDERRPICSGDEQFTGKVDQGRHHYSYSSDEQSTGKVSLGRHHYSSGDQVDGMTDDSKPLP